MSPVDHYTTHSTEMYAARVPALGSPADDIDDGVPEHVLTIRRDYTNDSETETPSTVKPSDEQRNLLS